MLAPEVGAEKVKTYHPERAFYFQVDISNLDQVASACDQALKVIPKGSLFGGVHCAAIAPSRPWTNKMKESAPVRIDRAMLWSCSGLIPLYCSTSQRSSTSTRTAHSSSTPALQMPSIHSTLMRGPSPLG